MRKLLLFLLCLCPCLAYGQGTQIQKTTVANLPNPPSKVNTVFTVTDGTSATDCTVGGGTTPVFCTWNGSAWSAAGGGGLASVTSLPATCTPGTTANVTLSTGVPNTQQEYQCGPAVNTWYPFNMTLAVSPLSYGAKWDVKAITDATFTLNSNTVTAPNSNMGVTSADLGKLVMGTTFPASETSGCSGTTCGSSLLATAQGFICTINSANSISIGTSFPACAANNASACVGGGVSQTGTICALVWGTQDDSTAIQNAATAAWGNGNSCNALEFPAGMAFFTVPSGGLLRVTVPGGNPCGTLISDATQTGSVVFGQGMGTTTLVPLPTVNFANCTGNTKACINPPNNIFAHDFSVQGFGNNDNSAHAINLFELDGYGPGCTAMAAWNMSFNNWEGSSATSQGFAMNFGCGVQYASNIIAEAFGNIPCYLGSAGANNNLTVSALDCFGSAGGNNGYSLLANGPGNINSTGSMYWGGNISSGSSAAAAMQGSVVFNSFGDIFMGPSNSSVAAADFGIYMPGGTNRLILSGSTVIEPNSAANQNRLFYCSGGATCNIFSYGSTLKSSANGVMFYSAGSTINFTDSCANAYTAGGVANNGTVNFFGSCSITGTPIAAGNLVLSAGWGTTAAWSALSGSTQQVFGTITASGTGQGANPTITYTFPTAFLATPTGCFALQVGGTQAGVAIPFTPSALSKTGVTFTYNGTPGAGNTLAVQIQCWNP